jgi:YbbR domain-containing protein
MGLHIDVGRAILALALASALWIVVQNEQNPDRTDMTPFLVPVEVINTPGGLIVVSEAAQVQLRVRAPSDAWPALRPGSFRVTADASEARAGINELGVTVESLLSQVRAVDPVPPRVNVAIEELTDRFVPIRLNLGGNVPVGYAYTAPRITPETVQISGPASAVSRVDSVLVDIRLEGITVSINATYVPRPIDARGETVRTVRVSPATINVEIGISQQISYKEVGVRPVTRGRVASGYFLEPIDVEPASVTVVGPPDRLQSLNFVETEPVELGGVSSSVVRRAGIALPPGLSLLQPQPVTLTIRPSPLTTSQTIRATPALSGLSPTLQVVGEIPPLDITLSGSAPTVQGLSARDFRIVLDLTGRPSGRHEIFPQVTAPAAFTIERIEPSPVIVTLREVPQPEPSPNPLFTPAR